MIQRRNLFKVLNIKQISETKAFKKFFSISYFILFSYFKHERGGKNLVKKIILLKYRKKKKSNDGVN